MDNFGRDYSIQFRAYIGGNRWILHANAVCHLCVQLLWLGAGYDYENGTKCLVCCDMKWSKKYLDSNTFGWLHGKSTFKSLNIARTTVSVDTWNDWLWEGHRNDILSDFCHAIFKLARFDLVFWVRMSKMFTAHATVLKCPLIYPEYWANTVFCTFHFKVWWDISVLVSSFCDSDSYS